MTNHPTLPPRVPVPRRRAPGVLEGLAWAPFAWIVLVFLLAATYAFPQTDDFCTFGRLFQTSGGNPFAETWYLYQHWTGRYASSFAIAAVGWLSSVVPAPLQAVYAASLVAMILAFVASCVALSRLVPRGAAPNLPFAALLACAGLVLMPSKLEGLFWVTGAAVYFIGSALLFWLMQRLGPDRDPAREGLPWLEAALVIACVGMNEFLALALGAFLVLRMALFARTRAYARDNAILFGTFAAALAFSVFAPGNFARDAGIAATRHDLGLTIDLAHRSLYFFGAAFVGPNALLLLLVLAAAFVAGWVAAPERWRAPGHAARFLPAPLVLLASFPMHLVVYSFLSGEETPGRILNQALLLMLAGALLLSAWAGGWLATRKPAPRPRAAHVLMLLAGIGLLASPQFRQLSTTVRDFGQTWRTQQVDRHQRLVAAARGAPQPVAVPAFTSEGASPPLFQGADIGTDPAGWVNQCVASFYGVPAVQLETGAPATP